MDDKKKRISGDASPFRRKKRKIGNSTSICIDTTFETNKDNYSHIQSAELLNAENVREGMLLLGCVTEIKPTFFIMSLPGCLSGKVPMTNISNAFTNALKNFARNTELEEPSVEAFVQVGMVFPCKVIEISQDLCSRKPYITLSINPEDVNSELRPACLYSKMVLFVSVCSIEDNGYIVDVGTKCIQGFLPRQNFEDKSQQLKIGEVIPTSIKQISICDKTSAKIQLTTLDFNEDFPEISVEDIKLPSVLPGAKIRADVIDIQHPFVYMKYLCFDACASVLSLGSTYNIISIGSTIIGTVLYVHPITHIIYLMLNLKPSPHLFAEYFGLKKYTLVTNLKFQCFYKKHAYYKISKGTYGFINAKDLPDSKFESTGNPEVSKACILFFHYMDNLVQMSAKLSMTEKNIVLPEDIKIGDIYCVDVKRHVKDGMFVQICTGLSGFVKRIFMADIFVTKPEILYPVGCKINCRVLSKDSKGRINLTSKKSLLNLQDRFIPLSYENIQQGQFYKGVIVKKTDNYILVLFFYNIKGIVHPQHVPEGSVFFEGQTVLCEVLFCSPLKKSLKLSLKTEVWCGTDELDCSKLMLWDETLSNINAKTKITTIKGTNCSKELHKKDIDSEKKIRTKMGKIMDKCASDISTENAYIGEYGSQKSVEAVIISVKADQLNILLCNMKGRVHITELGCLSENEYPLRKFFVGQKIRVFIIGEHLKKQKNFLQITHKNFISFKECSLKFSSDSFYQELNPGTSLIGFVKEVHDVSSTIYLTHTQIGVLDYLHFSVNPKVVRKLRRHLKVGLSLKVSVLEKETDSGNHIDMHRITLTKIEKNLPLVGKNILGLVQVACYEKGLTLKLPFGYHGYVGLTDLTDIYHSVKALLDKYSKLKFLLCHVLEVNHETRYCKLSLRKSRVYGKRIGSHTPFCPEIVHNSLKEGEVVKGFVKSITDSAITVVLGRNLEGKIKVHNCKSPDCDMCNVTKNIIVEYSIGSVVEVFIQKKSVDARSSVLLLTDSKSLKDAKLNRLNITDDISWNELE